MIDLIDRSIRGGRMTTLLPTSYEFAISYQMPTHSKIFGFETNQQQKFNNQEEKLYSYLQNLSVYNITYFYFKKKNLTHYLYLLI